MFLISQLWSKEIGTSFKGMLHSILVFKIKKIKTQKTLSGAIAPASAVPTPGEFPLVAEGMIDGLPALHLLCTLN